MRPWSTTLALLLIGAARLCAADALGATRVATWQDDKQAAIMLMFDDSCMTDVTNAIPELVKRQLVGTFYLNPGGGHYAAKKQDWEVTIPKLGMEYANHTFTHKGAKDAADLDDELVKANAVIERIAGANPPTLISFGRPGVKEGAWTVTDQELKDALAKHHLIMRPDVSGRFSFINLKTVDELYGIVEKALAKHGADCVIFHGVGGDWLTTSMPIYTGFLDRVAAARDRLWVAGHIAVYKYQVERDGATVNPGHAGSDGIALSLATSADAKVFDAPLTLVTAVPAAWKHCVVTQGKNSATVEVVDGHAVYDARPDGTAITLKAGH